MRRYILPFLLFTSTFIFAQQISFQKNFPTGNNSHITTFTELRSLEIMVGYTLIHIDTSHLGPHTLELHLMKLDKNGNQIWDKLMLSDTTRFAEDRYTIQNIDEQSDGSLLLDVTHPYGEKYLVKCDAEGNEQHEFYLHNSFGDYNVYAQLIKERGRNLALPDGTIISVGASFTSILPKATLSVVNGSDPFDYFYYTGYFNDAYYFNFDHLYTVGVEQSGVLETLVFSDLKTDGRVNYHVRTPHINGEKIVATSLLYAYDRIRVAESVSYKDLTFYVRVFDYDHSGKLLAAVKYPQSCAATCISVSTAETDWSLSGKCRTDQSQSIQKMGDNGHLGFSFSDTIDNVIMLKKLRDGNYLFTFSKGSGINLWKLNIKGGLQSGTLAEGHFAPNPAKDYINFVGNKDTYGHDLTIKLFDMLGNTLMIQKFDKMQPVTLNLTGMREGIYCYNIVTDAGVEFKGKIVINQINYR